MFIQRVSTVMDSIDQQDVLVEAIEAVLAQYREWQITQRRIQMQIALEFRVSSLPTQDQVCTVLQHFHIFADALRLVADQLESEVEETTNQFYDWLYD